MNDRLTAQVKYDLRFSQLGISNTFGRLKRINERLRRELQLTPHDVLLDIGCNAGDLVSYLHPVCRQVTGIDINEEAIRHSKVAGLYVMDARHTWFPEAYFTKIVSSHTIEHIPNLEALFQEIDRILRPGGVVVLLYPWELWRGMATMRNAWIFFRNPFKGYKFHVNRLNHRKIARLISETRLKIWRKTMHFDPWPGYITTLMKIL